MNGLETSLTGSGVVVLIVEGLKLLWRKLVVKNDDYNFPAIFYAIAVPVLNALAPFALFALGVSTDSPVLSMGWQDILRYVALVTLASLVSFVGYSSGVKPLKEYDTKVKTEAKLVVHSVKTFKAINEREELPEGLGDEEVT